MHFGLWVELMDSDILLIYFVFCFTEFYCIVYYDNIQ